jgi:hypothetical protein
MEAKSVDDFCSVRSGGSKCGSLRSAFGHDLSDIRVHTGAHAAEAARSYNAAAFTVGRDIFLDASVQNANPAARRHIIAHEIGHALQQHGASLTNGALEVSSPDSPYELQAEAMADQATRGAVTIAPTAAPLHVARALKSSWTTMDRADFDTAMASRFGVIDVHTGEYGEQEQMVDTRPGITPNPGLTPAMWHRWDPGSSSVIYRYIIEGVLDFASQIGGVPEVKHVIFFDMCYLLNSAGVAVPQPDTAADFGAGTLTIYRSAESTSQEQRPALPMGRSVTSGQYPGAPTLGFSTRGSTPGAPLLIPTQREAVRRTITHELGHGLVEAAMSGGAGGAAPEPEIVTDYAQAVGWYISGATHELYDAGRGDVRAALAAGRQPPQQYHITADDWNNPKWIEQPLSLYMVSSDNEPGDDFAEAVKTYVAEPALLRARSPRRFAFIDSHKSKWLRQLTTPKPAGQTPQFPLGGFKSPTSSGTTDILGDLLK